jgi:hypothetical protein
MRPVWLVARFEPNSPLQSGLTSRQGHDKGSNDPVTLIFPLLTSMLATIPGVSSSSDVTSARVSPFLQEFLMAFMLRVLVPVLFLLATPCLSPAQDQLPGKAALSASSGLTQEETAEINVALASILESMQRNTESLRDAEARLKEATSEEMRARIQRHLNELSETMDRQRQNFSSIAAGMVFEETRQPDRTKLDLQEQFRELVGPILEEMRDITARPREINQLRTELEYLTVRLPRVEKGLARIATLLEHADDPELKGVLERIQERWEERRSGLVNDISVSQYQLKQKLSEQESFTGSARTIFQKFFKTRGKNLLLAVTLFFGSFFLLRFMLGMVHRHTPLHRVTRDNFFLRLFDVLSYVFIFFLAAFAAVFVLYTSGDWVMLGLFILFLLAVLWSAKQGLMRFFEHAKLILNIGGVREGERLVRSGIPYLVERLHYYSILVNPALTSERIRVRLDELVPLASRQFHKDEPWFPSQKGDWVLLDDGTFGLVEHQSPEMVQLRLFADALKTYTTEAYLAQNPKNISPGFTVGTVFGIDYQHQVSATDQVPATIKTEVERALEEAGFGSQVKYLTVEFKEAGSSSLDIVIWVGMEGSAARNYFSLERLLQKTCVQTATKNNWTIPFPQLTLHQANGRS